MTLYQKYNIRKSMTQNSHITRKSKPDLNFDLHMERLIWSIERKKRLYPDMYGKVLKIKLAKRKP